MHLKHRMGSQGHNFYDKKEHILMVGLIFVSVPHLFKTDIA